MKFKQSALRIAASTLARILEPPIPITPSQWAKENLVVPDGPRAGERWDASLTPYILEPLDKLGAEDATNKVVIQKSAQTGFTTLGIAWVGYTIDRDPCRMGIVQPTDSALSDFLKEKLNPAIEATPVLAAKVRQQQSRSGEGSTTYTKRYPGGSLSCLIATSTAAMRGKTFKKILKDEASEYPSDLDGQGSPHAMLEARYISFLSQGDWKELNISTPVIKGSCYISEEFEAGDQRYWHVNCPGCKDKFFFRFDRKNFRFKDTYPYEAHYVAPCCGTIIDAHQKNALVRGGEWIALAPGAGKHLSYHFDALSSPFVPWDKIAEQYLRAGDDSAKLKGFYNLVLGEPYEFRTDVPDSARLLERREEYPRYIIPPRGLLLVGAADVQMRGIYFEIKAYAQNGESWVVDADYLDGDTASPHEGAFLKLDEIYHRQYQTSYGSLRKVDVFGVDSGYRSNAVYNWVRLRPGAMALDGRPGWNRPAISPARPVDIDLSGKRIAKGAAVYPVGTYDLKLTFYSQLRKEGRQTGKESDLSGYCHYPYWLDEDFFRQITAEYLKMNTTKGRATHTWERFHGRDNHYLDCEIYNLALAEYLGLSRMNAEEWAWLAKQYNVPEDAKRDDLFLPAPLQAVQQTEIAQNEAAQEAKIEQQTEQVQNPPPTRSDWFGGRNKGWFKR